MYTHILYNPNYGKGSQMTFFSSGHMEWILLEFINHLNTVHSSIKFTRDISPTEIPFLDLIINTTGSKLYTRLHTKTTDRHMYLNFRSEHPLSLKKPISYSQFLRLKGIHTEPNIYWRHKCICIFSLSGGISP